LRFCATTSVVALFIFARKRIRFMKRKHLMTILTLTLALCSILGLTACGHEQSYTTHEHSYTTSVTAPTCTEQGYTTYTCSCGDSYVDDYVDALDHDFKDYIYNNDAKCEQDGTETAICDRDNCEETNTRTKINSALSHNYGTPSYTWNGDKCTAIRICTNDNTHKEAETVTGTYVKDTDATCLVAEKGHYIATFSNSAFAVIETDDNSVVKGSPSNHKFNQYLRVYQQATCNGNRIDTYKCERCSETENKAEMASGANNFALFYMLEGGAVYCVDNQ
jgi:hypothetical protein